MRKKPLRFSNKNQIVSRSYIHDSGDTVALHLYNESLSMLIALNFAEVIPPRYVYFSALLVEHIFISLYFKYQIVEEFHMYTMNR